jgi:hypothetical protein
MAYAAWIRLDWDHTAIPLREAKRFFTVRVFPEPEYPFGRKGLTLTAAWNRLGANATGPNCDGMVILDGDTAIDPGDFVAMNQAIGAEPTAVHVAPVKLWPASTKQPSWIWGHGKGNFTQEDTDEPDRYGLSFTYLPRKLIENCIKNGLETWAYPTMDVRIAQQSRKLKLPVRVVRDASPKHLNC